MALFSTVWIEKALQIKRRMCGLYVRGGDHLAVMLRDHQVDLVKNQVVGMWSVTIIGNLRTGDQPNCKERERRIKNKVVLIGASDDVNDFIALF